MEGGRFRIALEFGSGRHDGDQNSARREKFDGMIYMVNVSPPVEGRVHDDAIETADQVRCEREKIHRENGLVPLLLLKLRSEEHTSELQSLMRISSAVFCLKKKNTKK